ncbi:MAG TPA: GreA/GreB family elongation factor [Verrucomicrobiota bacterium]|nr:GreA/GreB family elongation factor [Verrucomicrobiota bacterium]HNT13245.1 GreA/GreB family elongation factor [Verrucomicrobiota bacterium]
MKEEFEKLAAAGKIEGRQIEPLVRLTTSGFCEHRSWGFGRIKTVDTVFARFTIDFAGKPDHAMNLSFAAETLKPIPKDHILARKSVDLEGLQKIAALNHLDLIRIVLNSYDGKATVAQIQQALVPEVIRDDWKKWWETVRAEMKKDGHFIVPTKKSEPIVYTEQETSLQDRLLADFQAAKGLKARLAAATEVVKNAADLQDKAAVAREIIAALNADIPAYLRAQTAVALEAIFVREDVAAMAGLTPAADEITATQLWNQEGVKFGAVMEATPAAKHRRTLESFKDAQPDRWIETLLTAFNMVPARLCKEFASILAHNNQLPELKETLARLISQHAAGSELLLWLGKERSDDYADILGPEVFRAMLTAIEHDQFNEKRSNRLRDFMLSDQELIADLTGTADIEVVKDLTRALQFSPAFEDMDKRSLLARIVKRHPSVQSLITGEPANKQEGVLYVSWESLERRRAEYAELVQKKIPANSKEIAVARSYGDLRENHEYKSAKEMQKILMRRKGELEAQLARAQGTDFSNVQTDVVNIGTLVRVTDLNTNALEAFTVLGAWDFDVTRNIISYLTPVGQALLNRKVGDATEVEVDGVRHRYRIEKIEAYVPPAAPASSSEAAA